MRRIVWIVVTVMVIQSCNWGSRQCEGSSVWIVDFDFEFD